MKRKFIVITYFLLSNLSVFGQKKITLTDIRNIYSSATETLNLMPPLLNFITNSQTDEGDIATAITASFTLGNSHRIFYSKESYVSNDIQLSSKMNSDSLRIDDYLNELENQYTKTNELSITFSNFKTSPIKSNGEYTYILIHFDSKFGQTPYPVQKKVAELRLEKEDGRWKALISKISFYDPALPVDSMGTNLPVFRDTVTTAALVSYGEINKQIDSIEMRRSAANKENDARFDQLKNEGISELQNKNYDDAIEYFEKALDLKPADIVVEHKIRDIKRIKEQNSYVFLKARGDELMAQRRYKEANEIYKSAQEKNTEANLTATVIREIRTVLSVITQAQSYLDSKQYQWAIDECSRRIKEHKKDIANFPELNFIMGQAFEGLYLNGPWDTSAENGVLNDRNLNQALKNYNKAIAFFPNYIDALITRAKFYFVYQKNIDKSLGDYELILQDATDNSPYKPGYYVAEAKLKEAQGDSTTALALYAKAINLKQRTDTLYFEKGILLYKLHRQNEAKTNFDLAIKYNPKYRDAYFYRGLNYYSLKNNRLAGQDYNKLLTLDIKQSQKATIDSLSNLYFEAGEKLYDEQKFDGADSAYHEALVIYKNNANANHGIAKIYFLKAQTFYNSKKLIDARKYFEKSVYYNKEAIKCDPDFSTAYYQEGLANYMQGEYAQAIKNYLQAIRSDQKNVDALIAIGNTYLLIKKYDYAGKSFDQAIDVLLANLKGAKKNNNSELAINTNLRTSQIYQLAGAAHYYNRDFADALIYLGKALELNAKNAEAFYFVGLVNMEQNKLLKAIDAYSGALAIWNDYRYHFALGKAYYNNKYYPEAIDSFTYGIEADTLGVEIDRYYLRGLAYSKIYEYQKAFDDYIKFDKSSGAKSDTVYTNLAFADLYVNSDTLANIHFTKALTINNKNPMALYGFGCYYAKKEKFEMANKYFALAFETHLIRKADIKTYENDFLGQFKANKTSRLLYNEEKKAYLDN